MQHMSVKYPISMNDEHLLETKIDTKSIINKVHGKRGNPIKLTSTTVRLFINERNAMKSFVLFLT